MKDSKKKLNKASAELDFVPKQRFGNSHSSTKSSKNDECDKSSAAKILREQGMIKEKNSLIQLMNSKELHINILRDTGTLFNYLSSFPHLFLSDFFYTSWSSLLTFINWKNEFLR